MRRSGVLFGSAIDGSEYQAASRRFLQGLRNWVGRRFRNVRIDTRWATTNPDDIPPERGPNWPRSRRTSYCLIPAL